jgi:hypothetical protein
MMLAEFPMVHEAEASGRVAAVYADAAGRAPFVPSILKSLAVCPPYLVLAWQQMAPLLDDPAFKDAAAKLVEGVSEAAEPPGDAGDRQLLARFVEPLSTMLLLCSGLLAALDGELTGHSSAAAETPAQPAAPVAASVPSTSDLAAEADVLGRIRAALGTPIVNSIWRVAASEDRLRRIWDHLEPQAAPTRIAADELRQRADDAARGLPWRAVADRHALNAAGIADAEAGMREILEAYVITLPRVLALVASSQETSS